jgi:hypothetical protein
MPAASWMRGLVVQLEVLTPDMAGIVAKTCAGQKSRRIGKRCSLGPTRRAAMKATHRV